MISVITSLLALSTYAHNTCPWTLTNYQSQVSALEANIQDQLKAYAAAGPNVGSNWAVGIQELQTQQNQIASTFWASPCDGVWGQYSWYPSAAASLEQHRKTQQTLWEQARKSGWNQEGIVSLHSNEADCNAYLKQLRCLISASLPSWKGIC